MCPSSAPPPTDPSSAASLAQWGSSLGGNKAWTQPTAQQSTKPGLGEVRVKCPPAWGPRNFSPGHPQAPQGDPASLMMPAHTGLSYHLFQAAFPDSTPATGTHLPLRMPLALCIHLFLSEKFDLNMQAGHSFISPIGILHVHICEIVAIKQYLKERRYVVFFPNALLLLFWLLLLFLLFKGAMPTITIK